MTTSDNFKFKPRWFKWYVEQFTLPESYGLSNYQVSFVFPPKIRWWKKPYACVTNTDTMEYRYITYAEAEMIGLVKPKTYEDIVYIVDRIPH